MFLSPLFSLLPSFASGVAALVFWAGKSLFFRGWSERVNDFETAAEQIYCRVVVRVCGLVADSRVG